MNIIFNKDGGITIIPHHGGSEVLIAGILSVIKNGGEIVTEPNEGRTVRYSTGACRPITDGANEMLKEYLSLVADESP